MDPSFDKIKGSSFLWCLFRKEGRNKGRIIIASLLLFQESNSLVMPEDGPFKEIQVSERLKAEQTQASGIQRYGVK